MLREKRFVQNGGASSISDGSMGALTSVHFRIRNAKHFKKGNQSAWIVGSVMQSVAK